VTRARPRAGAPGARRAAARSLRLALAAVALGALAALTGAGRPWAQVDASVRGLGAGSVASGAVTGDALAPLSGLALLGLVLVVAVAATRGRGRWLVGAALLAVGVALAALALDAAGEVARMAAERARLGDLEGVPAGAALQIRTPRAGPALVVAGGALLAAAGLEALRRGRSWPALGAAFRAPGDRVPRPVADAEPPWEGD
jgi:uncharacterized membrane protein (TIGR02234 family)